MAFQPAGNLRNGTFVGLIIAQFLAGFNDQFIHASAMFYAIHTGILTEAKAISLMPILFYAPWAIFCTLSGYLADRFSKTQALRIWKFFEIAVALLVLAGFFVPPPIGPWMIMASVFLMGTHAAFFAPAKYGAMPEILQPHVLSRGNGILESTTFLAAIFGTVTGGLLFHLFRGQEYWIGVVLLVLSVIGAGASLMIAYLAPANPTRAFPTNLFKPLFENLAVLFRSKPLRLAVLGIAFFIFMVAYMRQCMYMHGETRSPRWDEFKTSLIVATVALGVGLGSPLAGFLSGGKIELGLVPLGCLGMIVGTLFAAFTIHMTWALVIGLIVIGFFSGFYMVPLYTLLQHRAPKTTKGDMIATSNFINVLGAMAASVLFFILVFVGQSTGVTPQLPQIDDVAVGVLAKPIEYTKHTGRPKRLVIDLAPKEPGGAGERKTYELKRDRKAGVEKQVLDEFEEGFFEILGTSIEPGDKVIVSSYEKKSDNHQVTHFRIRLASQELKPVYDNDGLPSYLFIGAALMTMGILVLLTRQLPDFFIRSLFWLRSLSRFKLKAVHMHNLPTNGPVILASNCHRVESNLQLVSATDRFTIFVLTEAGARKETKGLLRMLLKGSLFELPEGTTAEKFQQAEDRALQVLRQGNLLAVSVDQGGLEEWVTDIRQRTQAPVVPVYCGPLDPTLDDKHLQQIRVVFGETLPPEASLAEIRQAVIALGAWIRDNDGHVAGGH